ncbi:MAG: O-antigen ligase family protein [Acetatifactor sp.]|nr:O-antigen ligase family protein [Acetatifactor sp.]
MSKASLKNSFKAQHSESVLETIGKFCLNVLKILVWLSVVLVLVILPFYFQEGYTHIGSDKSYFFRKASVMLGRLILPVWGGCILCYGMNLFIHKKKGQLPQLFRCLCITDYFAFFYGVCDIISYFCSDYKETALWGTTGWFMGLIPQLTLVALYFLIRFFQTKGEWVVILNLLASAIVFVLGFLNRFAVFPIPMKYSDRETFISTIGNINWYCGYLMAVFFVGVGLLWLDQGEDKRKTWLLCGYVFVGFATLITQGSESGIFALAIVLFTLFVLSAKDGDLTRVGKFWLIILLLAMAGIFTAALRLAFPGRITFTFTLGDLLTYSPLSFIMAAAALAGVLTAHKGKGASVALLRRGMKIFTKICCIAIPLLLVIFIGMIAMNTVHPGSLGALSQMSVFTFNDRWGSSRGATWSIGLRCFMEQDFLHKLTGVGPDCMADFLYKDSSDSLLALAQRAFEKMRLTNAHCEILTILVNEGILGAICYGGMLISQAYSLIRSRVNNAYAAACGLCVLAYFANSLWSFQQTMGVVPLFVIMGLGGYFLHRGEE